MKKDIPFPKKLRAWVVVPFIDFKPFAPSDYPKVLVNSIIYNCKAIQILFLYLLRKIGADIDWEEVGNPSIPLECRVKTRVNDAELVFNIRKNSDDYYILRPLYEYEHLKYFRPEMGDVVFDVGAHVGKYTCYAGKLVGKGGEVISIEANPLNFSALQENIKLNALENVKAYNLAAADFNGIVELNFSKDFGGSSIIKKRGTRCVKVPAMRLDHLMESENIEGIDWMKIDVEGAELLVLKGLGKRIKDVKRILAEVSHENKDAFETFMRKNNFEFKIISTHTYHNYYFAERC